MIEVTEIIKRFHSLYRGQAKVFRAPGRVNLIGEHTDYNDGFVMPAAINFYTWVAASPRDDHRLSIYSDNYSEKVEFDLDEPDPSALGHWSDYVRGVAVMLAEAGHDIRGANLLILGEVPIGSGLSSSAAIEVAAGFALMTISGISINRLELAKLCRRAENDFVGARVGIMDQFVSCHGERDRALMLDCRSLDYRHLPLPAGVKLVVCNTMIRHQLAGGEYNARRAECEAGVAILAKLLPHVRALRDVNVEQLERYGGELPPLVYRRCRHVTTENARVIEAAAALERGDLNLFGRLMRESHLSLRHDYEVSCAELDLMVELAEKVEGVYGARMTGGGFGGCTINLVEAGSVEVFKREVASGYEQSTGIAPEIYVCDAAPGVEQVETESPE
ncbi:MAG TPA: galactokinase [Blastocatellia bacterium]|nr:galactokinase [Blastocatellia bacterium]